METFLGTMRLPRNELLRLLQELKICNELGEIQARALTTAEAAAAEATRYLQASVVESTKLKEDNDRLGAHMLEQAATISQRNSEISELQTLIQTGDIHLQAALKANDALRASFHGEREELRAKIVRLDFINSNAVSDKYAALDRVRILETKLARLQARKRRARK